MERPLVESEWGKEVAYAAGRAAGLAEGRVEGRRETILRVLMLRELEITDDQRGRILACKDPELLSTWYDRSITAESVTEIFGEAHGPTALRVFVAFGAALDEVDGVECGLVDEALAFGGG